VRLTPEGAGAARSGEFYGGAFVLASGGAARRPRLRLYGARACGAAVAAKRKRRRKPRLWGDVKGTFNVVGRYGSAINTGTRWLTEDRCAGTLFRVEEGAIRVRRPGRPGTVRVTAGETYVARAPRRSSGPRSP
jgi:hypothetical protein